MKTPRGYYTRQIGYWYHDYGLGKAKYYKLFLKYEKQERRSVNETLIENVEEVIVHLVKRAKIVNKLELKKLN